ncbi:DNA mismatch repair endonuclease MutL [Desulfonema magnum]|uniref:DNA mismatch repair protein MutL n=1 Tax=Desulfonema magnum TaxID=45655 RepID=A0A975BN52_9BACT|nr:DNA mismatch repair endonuclease MutL [Desulfonema magnum]QTA88536.1 DNA mismatch repair protein [Desulfonema magnum]
MSRIKILPENLSNKIAAGEVVERPASVVKELVENALDANSSRIIVEVEKGGRSLIRISDNGIGMNHDDALLATERYATSKIRKDNDLFSIKTLGFRGEALPSIAAVSRFTLETKDKTSEAGTRIIIEGGTIRDVSEIGAPAGTLISVKQLFFNTPARRKFLKTVNTEMGHIADTVANIALGWPRVQFRLHHNGKIVKNWIAVSDPADRIADVLGKDMRNMLHRTDADDNVISVSGWIASPRMARKTSRGIYVYVNGRFVKDKIIQHALFRGYSGRLMKGQFPVAVLFINIPSDQVDVNVHPTKNEVRFAQQNRVHGIVADAVSKALNLADRPVPPTSRSQAKNWDRREPSEQPYISETADFFSPQTVPLEKKREHQDMSSKKGDIRPALPVKKKKSESIKTEGDERTRFFPEKQASLWENKPFRDLRVIGQFHGTYIICESDEGLVLIDQHAAHERVLFEQLKKQSSSSRNTSQKLLISETIDLSYSEADILEKLIPDFNDTGFEIEPFGGNTFVVKSVPAILGHGEIKPLITEIVEKMANIGVAPGLENIMDECLILMACHGAIRANQQLSDEQIRTLLTQLDECENSSHCPHGRPILIRWTLSFLEKSFKRIV